MTAHGTIRSAVQALHDGAEDYLTKPVDVEEMEHLLDRIMSRKRLLSETRLLRERLDDKYGFENIIGRSPQMLAVFGLVEQVAPSQASILITGESGTGKELIAQAIHQRSPRRDAPFVKVSCAALPETLLESELFGHERGAFTGALSRRAGRFEMAAGGTIFLDEIGDIPAAMQVKLLRFLQERQFERLGGNQTLTVDVRILTATHRDLRALIREGSFREDLYYRLDVIEINLPPLRTRAQDIPLLADFFIRKISLANGKEISGLTDETLAALMAWPWPGNVRELEHAIERAVILARDPRLDLSLFPMLTPGGPVPKKIFGPRVPGASLEEIERDAILRTLEAVDGSTTRAAEILQISPRTIQYKLKEYRAEQVQPVPGEAQRRERRGAPEEPAQEGEREP
jgi:DNA-binding NtrC family response regulator